jgi:hypothetical protein
MSVTVGTADELFDLLAGDEEEVPRTLIRSASKESKHQKALADQAELERLNRVEKWMKTADCIKADPGGFLSVGETIFLTLLKAHSSEFSISVTQKLAKLAGLWLKVSKSCKLLEHDIRPELVCTLLGKLMRTKSPSALVQETCGRILLGMIQCSPNRLMIDEGIRESFNRFIRLWAKGSYRGNGSLFLNLFPTEFISRLAWVPSSRVFTLKQICDIVIRVSKRKLVPILDIDAFVCMALKSGKEQRAFEEELVKFGMAIARSNKSTLTPKYLDWVQEVADRDVQKPGVSVRIVRLAKEHLKLLDRGS